jgi:hypothetical protein
MTEIWRATLDPGFYPAVHEVEVGGPTLSWSAIWAGTATAIAVSLMLLAIGAGFGLAPVSAWPGAGPEPTEFAIGAGIWLIVMQWVSSATGGYIAGRLRARWHSLHSHEVFFRDTAQGLITWAVATIAVAGTAVLVTTLAGLAAPVPDAVSITPEMAEQARKAAVTLSLFTGFSMLIGAFIACVASAIGGQLRDKHP